MKYVLGIWIVLSIVWWVLAIREAKRDRFRITFPELVVMLAVLFLVLPFALVSVMAGAIQGLWYSVRNN